ncbi:O-antigen ligase domain-containing protein [Rhodococcus sp. Eu-32]|uniref:O-antigen ligase family protein n=1 Tax=Rhodococcus sp. Eu-32 TaxID=1017319 RepID=UPI000DF38318|nr:O-antigen ligase family protein [Rhodococcus sp. Eu-32]RRQ29218.1 O-antigen ligase domain-containing protein [Rhodococcus sp. Eu-32]
MNLKVHSKLAWAAVYLLVLGAGAAVASSFWAAPIVVIVAGTVCFLSYLSPYIGWALYVFAIMANGLVVSAPFGTLRPEMLALPILILVCLKLRIVNCGVRGILYLPIGLCFFATLWLSITALSSAATAPESLRSLWITLQIVLAFITYALIANNAQKQQLIKTGSLVLGAIAALSLAGYFASKFLGVSRTVAPGVADDGRLIGFSFEVNIFAAQCIGWLALICVSQAALGRWLIPITSVLFVSCLLSGTRAAWVALVILAAVVGRRWLSESRILQICVALLGLLAFVGYLSSYASTASSTDDIAWRISNILNTSQGTGGYRLDIYETAISDITSLHRFLFGSGANSFSQYHLMDSTNVGTPYLSSVWPAVLYDSGVVGLIAFIAVMVLCVRRFELGLKSAIVPLVLLICATTTNITWFAFFWIILGLVATQKQVTVDDLAKPVSRQIYHPFKNSDWRVS